MTLAEFVSHALLVLLSKVSRQTTGTCINVYSSGQSFTTTLFLHGPDKLRKQRIQNIVLFTVMVLPHGPVVPHDRHCLPAQCRFAVLSCPQTVLSRVTTPLSSTSEDDASGTSTRWLPLSLLGIPWEIRREILFELLSLEKNEIITVRPPILDYSATFAQKIARRLKYGLDLAGFTVLDTCCQLYNEGMQVLLSDNHLIAIIGRQDIVEQHLDYLDLHSYLKPESWIGTWDRRKKYFDLGDRIFQPEITIRFQDVEEDGPILLPARHLSAAVLAVCGPQEPLNKTPIELTIKSRRGKLWIKGKQERTIEDLPHNLLLWLAKDLAGISTVRQALDTGEEKACAHALCERLRAEVVAVRQFQQNDDSRRSAFFLFLKRFTVNIEKHMSAGHEDKTLKAYQELTNRYSVFKQRDGAGQLMDSKLFMCFCYASYRIAA